MKANYLVDFRSFFLIKKDHILSVILATKNVYSEWRLSRGQKFIFYYSETISKKFHDDAYKNMNFFSGRK